MSTNQPKPIKVGGLAVLTAGVALAVGLAGVAPSAAAWVRETIDPPWAEPTLRSGLLTRTLPAPPDEDAIAVQIEVPPSVSANVEPVVN